MNILPHKSWHVYNQKNRDRVRKDEAEAEAKNKRKAEETLAADREYKLKVLRDRAKRRVLSSNDTEILDEGQPNLLEKRDSKSISKDSRAQHVNFWADLEGREAGYNNKGNEEYEAEKKAKLNKFERKSGMFLDNVKGKEPWLLPTYSQGDISKKDRDHNFSKVREDPMSAMKSMLGKRDEQRLKKYKSSSSPHKSETKRLQKGDEPLQPVHKEKELSTIEKLRKERLEREQAEQTKVHKLLNPDYVDPQKSHGSVGAYSQQFNPEATNLAHSSSVSIKRQERNHDHYHGRAYSNNGSGGGLRHDEYPPRDIRDRYSRPRRY
ncbi:hypothetical protein BX616_000558 [Lobosporangium transversale]|uniref:CBF1-interacting co-repressor CIR N-terminal domain-containing protein n=1 Tax=Lobosporangium transversale TaxID=64571 RepID=A0A1Y2G897_9FUNG|nr:hypothetical protein BCR41DRAFT_401974 [Lobosporangium transversale]KAF9906977.1 hypothetical protein BX616_000558 [Lobosporangium transversale]ORY98295.1 hypothetical protein BCR41DRAFT_401974 [Lobosporangium transversale]|eukprot:XP_021875724.1 hypothetical protein BCR41DRAFT_401974 [Lobosporangium transversale]